MVAERLERRVPAGALGNSRVDLDRAAQVVDRLDVVARAGAQTCEPVANRRAVDLRTGLALDRRGRPAQSPLRICGMAR